MPSAPRSATIPKTGCLSFTGSVGLHRAGKDELCVKADSQRSVRLSWERRVQLPPTVYRSMTAPAICRRAPRSRKRLEEHTSELQSPLAISNAHFFLTKKHQHTIP